MDSRTLFLGDLSCFCVESDVIQLLYPYGEIESLRLMKSERSGKCLGYGFITFKTMESTLLALRLDGTLFMGRHIKVNQAYSSKEKDLKLPQQSRQGKKPKHDENSGAQIHFSYLSEQASALVTEETIRNIFMEFGVVEDVSIKRTQTLPNSRVQHGYGFIRFRHDHNETGAALQAVSVICQVDINHVLYDCCLTRSFEASLYRPVSSRITSFPSTYKPQTTSTMTMESPREHRVLSACSSDASLTEESCLTRSFEASSYRPVSSRIAAFPSTYKPQATSTVTMESSREHRVPSTCSSDASLNDEMTAFSTYYQQSSPRSEGSYYSSPTPSSSSLSSPFTAKCNLQSSYSLW